MASASSSSGGDRSDYPLSPFDQELHALIQEGLSYPKGSAKRRRIVNQIVRKLQQSGRIFRDRNPAYEDALMQTWQYFSANLWVADTAKTAFSEPNCHILARFNEYLRFRLRDAKNAQSRELQERAQVWDGDENATDIVERIPNPESTEASPDERQQQAAQVREMIRTDPTGELQATHVRGREDITAQILLMQRGLEDTDWRVLAAELDSRISTLSGFYQNKCLPLIRRLFNAPPP